MLFSSLEFLLFFLPCVLGIYFLLPRSGQNVWLLFASLFFYAWGEPVFVLIMLTSILVNYLLALRLEELRRHSAGRKLILAVDLLFNLGLLFVFKYLNFVTGTLVGWFPDLAGSIPVTNLALPIGISFFTFQALSYVIDVYRGTPAQRNPVSLGLYISFFPQLIAGPIVRYTDIAEEIRHRRTSFDGLARGLGRFFLGFNKKILLANTISEVADAAFGAATNTVAMAWLGAVAYALQIYFDFSGYSDMAIGLGRMFGFHFQENFNDPYMTRTVSEFWRRWHISLSSWFRDYVYIPLGGSRRGLLIRIRNLLIVWTLTGIWHGANWTFLCWGGLYGLLIVLEAVLKIPERLPSWKAGFRALYRVGTLLVILLAWVLFRADSLGAAWSYLKSLFGFGSAGLCDPGTLFYAREYAVYLALGLLCATPLFRVLRERIENRAPRMGHLLIGSGAILQFLLFIVSVSFLVVRAHNPFIYFNF